MEADAGTVVKKRSGVAPLFFVALGLALTSAIAYVLSCFDARLVMVEEKLGIFSGGLVSLLRRDPPPVEPVERAEPVETVEPTDTELDSSSESEDEAEEEAPPATKA